jgi:alcohol dehydrogenase class IV
MRFEFATATRVLFGEGVSRDLPAMGARPLVVTGASGRHARDGVRFPVEGEPTVDHVRRGVALAQAESCDHVIAIGGGSAIDAGKAIAALLANPGDPLDYLEVVGLGRPLTNGSVPLIAIPTTAGTGSEVTRNAVLAATEHGMKASLRGAGMFPRLAAVDPELTYNLPPAITASTGLDALAQVIEPFVSIRANPLTDLVCREGIRRIAIALPRAFEDGADREARSGMAWGSLCGGLALANAGLGAVHGFASPIGGMFPAAHGAVCAVLLPHAVEINVEALRSRAPQSTTLARYDEVARLLTGQPHATAEDAVWWLTEICAKLQIPPLRDYGVEERHIPELVAKAATASSMKANPIQLTTEELTEMVTRAR